MGTVQGGIYDSPLYPVLKPHLDKYKSERCYSGLIFKQGQRT
jgi:hypothetical protein